MIAAVLALATVAAAAEQDAVAVRVFPRDAEERAQLLREVVPLDHSLRQDGSFAFVARPQAVRDLERRGLRAETDGALMASLARSAAAGDLDGYRRTAAVFAELRRLASAHPALAEVVDAGDSWCKTQGGCVLPSGARLPGHDILALRITNRGRPGPKPTAFFVAGHHSREIHTTEIALRFADWLLAQYGVDADAHWLVDDQETWILPVGNPDGHELVWMGNGPWWQRKNASVLDSAPWLDCAWPPAVGRQSGVDLNRHHDFHWRTPGTGWQDEPCGETWPGAEAAGAASQPELRGYTALVRSVFPDQKGEDDDAPAPEDASGTFVTLHSGDRLLLYPWDHTPEAAPNAAGLRALWDKVATWSPGWMSCQTGRCYQTISGGAADWAYGTLGVAAALWEIGDFMPAYSRVDAEYWPHLFPMMRYTARVARAPYLLPEGPDVRDLRVPASVTAGAVLAATALADDSWNGNGVLAAAEVYVDVPPWAGGTPRSVLPEDGAFDTPTEPLGLRLDSCALGSGPHTLYLRARDEQEHWGPVFAAFTRVDGSCPAR